MKAYIQCGLESSTKSQIIELFLLSTRKQRCSSTPSIFPKYVPYGIYRILTIVHNIQNYWCSGLCPSSERQEVGRTTFRKLDLLPSSNDRKTPTLLGPLKELASITGPT
jgi:hypothetical protein